MKLNECRRKNNSSTANCGENESSVDLSERELMLSEHDLPVGLQGHLSAESDCGRLQLSRSRRGREGSM